MEAEIFDTSPRIKNNHDVALRLRRVMVVPPAGFEPATFTLKG